MRKPGLARLAVSLLEDRSLPAPVASLWIGDRVWNDLDGNGQQNDNEPGIAGVTVRLYRGDNLVGTTRTRSEGFFAFDRSNVNNGTTDRLDDGLEPMTTYQVRIDPSQDSLFGLGITHANSGLEASDSDGVPTNGLAVATITTGATGGNTNVDLGFSTAYSIGNLVWNDRNNNGRRDPGEPGIGGVRLRLLDATGTIELGRTVTSTSGTYNFGGIIRGKYVVEIESANFGTGQPLAGLSSSTGVPGSSGPTWFEGPASAGFPIQDSYDNGFALPSGAIRSRLVTVEASNRGVDFGLFAAGQVRGRLFNDVNGNGQLDASETSGPAGARVRAIGPAGTFYVATDGTGSYSFNNLPAGRYAVSPVGRVNGYGKFTPQKVDVVVTANGTVPVANFSGAPAVDVRFGISTQSSFVALGDEIVFTLQLRNLGASTANDMRVSLSSGAGLTILGVLPGGQGTMTNGTWTVGNMTPGQRATIQVRARVTALADISLTGDALSASPESNRADNRATTRLIPWAIALQGDQQTL